MSETKSYHWNNWNITIWQNEYGDWSYVASRGQDYKTGAVRARGIHQAFWMVAVVL